MKINPIGHLVKTNPKRTQSNPILSAVGGLQMNISSVLTKDYRKKDDFAVRKNKPNSNPIKPNPPARYAIRNTRYEIQTQSKPISPPDICFGKWSILCPRPTFSKSPVDFRFFYPAIQNGDKENCYNSEEHSAERWNSHRDHNV